MADFFSEIGQNADWKGSERIERKLKEFSADSKTEKKTQRQSIGKKLSSDTSFMEKRDIFKGAAIEG